MPQVRFQLEALVGAAYDTVEDLSFTQLWASLPIFPGSDPLRLDLVLLLEGVLEPVKTRARPRAAVVVSVHEGPDLPLGVMEDGRVANAPDEAALDEVVRQRLLPRQRRVARAIKAQP